MGRKRKRVTGVTIPCQHQPGAAIAGLPELIAYDLTGSYRAAAELCGCSHHTVKKAVEDRDAGLPPATQRARTIDDWRDLLETWVADSKGKIRGDKAHDKLVALGYGGSDRTTRRALAEFKAQWRRGNTRAHRPWITEPGLWLQYASARARWWPAAQSCFWSRC